jgi:hypothetical protein
MAQSKLKTRTAPAWPAAAPPKLPPPTSHPHPPTTIKRCGSRWVTTPSSPTSRSSPPGGSGTSTRAPSSSPTPVSVGGGGGGVLGTGTDAPLLWRWPAGRLRWSGWRRQPMSWVSSSRSRQAARLPALKSSPPPTRTPSIPFRVQRHPRPLHQARRAAVQHGRQPAAHQVGGGRALGSGGGARLRCSCGRYFTCGVTAVGRPPPRAQGPQLCACVRVRSATSWTNHRHAHTMHI